MLQVVLDFVIPGSSPDSVFAVIGNRPIPADITTTIRITRERRIVGDDSVWMDFTGRLWIAQTTQQYMLHFTDGVLISMAPMADSDEVLTYLKYVRVAGEHTLPRLTYRRIVGELKHRLAVLPRYRSRVASDWSQVTFLRKRQGLSLYQAKAIVRALKDTRLHYPIPADYIVKYAQ